MQKWLSDKELSDLLGDDWTEIDAGVDRSKEVNVRVANKFMHDHYCTLRATDVRASEEEHMDATLVWLIDGLRDE